MLAGAFMPGLGFGVHQLQEISSSLDYMQIALDATQCHKCQG